MPTPRTIDFSRLTDKEIEDKLKGLNIPLATEEAKKIQHEILKRPPTVAECVLWSIEGSEHCSYKSSRPFLKQFVTEGPTVMLGPAEDAGIVEIARDNAGKKYGIVMSHESHNHPSQIVPYEGAATGIGGNVRDVACMGAKVIACADSLRFGQIQNPKSTWIHAGVVSGIAGYGNPIGVANIGGDAYYNPSYNENCLVNVVTLGVLSEDDIIHSKAPENSDGFDIILVGKPTDNSGFGGASFASLKLKEEESEANKGAVQEPNAFLKRHLLKAAYTLFAILKEKDLLSKVGFKDLGAGGISCAAVEMADSVGLGAEIILDKVPTAMENLSPEVILCAETQERFMWVAHPDITNIIVEHYNKTFDLPKVSKGARAALIGKIRADGQFVVKHNNETYVRARAGDVTQGIQYNRPYQKPNRLLAEPLIPEPKSYNEILLKVLSHENVACRVPIYEQYDKNVQGISVIEPGEADAGVMQPFKSLPREDAEYPPEIQKTGIALSVDQNPRYCKIDPYLGAVNAVIESMRNVASVGAAPHALTDCLNFGNPENEEQMWEFAEGTRGVADAGRAIHIKEYPASPVPIIAGNVSFYNESEKGSIAPSPVIACLGKLRDVDRAITMHLKNTNSVLLMTGERRDELGGSVYYDICNELGANLPNPDLKNVEQQIFALTDAIDAGMILACHDISDGGIAVALCEMSFKNEIGFNASVPAQMRPDQILFSETGGFIMEAAPDKIPAVREVFSRRNVQVFEIGKTASEKRIIINSVVNLDLTQAKDSWTNGLREKL